MNEFVFIIFLIYFKNIYPPVHKLKKKNFFLSFPSFVLPRLNDDVKS